MFKVGDRIKSKGAHDYAGIPRDAEFIVTCCDDLYVGFVCDTLISKYSAAVANGSKTNWGVNAYILVTENMNKKIIGYKLLKDTPDHNKGQKFILNKSNDWQAEEETAQYPVWYTEGDVTTKTQWFEPIYESKPTEVFVDTLAGKVRVTTKQLSLNSNGNDEYLNTSRFKEIQKLVAFNMTVDGFGIKVETFKVGCKIFHVDDIAKLQEAIKQVQ